MSIGVKLMRNGRSGWSAWATLGLRRANLTTSTKIPERAKVVSAHILSSTFEVRRYREQLAKNRANMSINEKFMVIRDCEELKHKSGTVMITNNGVIVLWGESNSSLEGYRSLVLETEELVIVNRHIRKSEEEAFSEFSETLDFKEIEGETRVTEGEIHITSWETRKNDEIAISLGLVTSVKLNYLESDIKKNLELRNKEVLDLRNGLKSMNLDKTAKKLFELETYAHDCRYRLNLQHDLLEYPEVLWDNEKQCELFNRVQSIFEVQKRLDDLNHRISWTLETLHSYSDYVRHNHSSRLEKIIIAVISVETILGLIQTIKTN